MDQTSHVGAGGAGAWGPWLHPDHTQGRMDLNLSILGSLKTEEKGRQITSLDHISLEAMKGLGVEMASGAVYEEAGPGPGLAIGRGSVNNH